MSIDNFLAIGIVGVFLSLAIQIIKKVFGTSNSKTKVLTIILAVAVGSFYYFLKDTIYWQTIIGVLASASTVYALFFNNIKK
jgi:hypothetical protein